MIRMREEDFWPKNSDEPIIYHIVLLEFEGHHPMLQILLQIYDGEGLVALAINNMRHNYLCEYILKIFTRELILVIHGYDQRISKINLHLSEL